MPMTNKNKMTKACLFDLDGVVFHTEPQYTVFWGEVGRTFHPEIENFEHKIKGMTLQQVYDLYFAGDVAARKTITARLNTFEANMEFPYIDGFEDYLAHIRKEGIATAVVTSSNQAKMKSVYERHPDFCKSFDRVFTSEDFSESKPSPDCYLRAAAHFGVHPSECIVFEDSINGLRSGLASGARLIALATTLPAERLRDYTPEVIADFTELLSATEKTKKE